MAPSIIQLHQRQEDEVPAAMPFGKPLPKFGPQQDRPPPSFNPDSDGDGVNDFDHDPSRKDDSEPKTPEAPEGPEGDVPSPNQDSGGSDDDGGGDNGNDSDDGSNDDSKSNEDPTVSPVTENDMLEETSTTAITTITTTTTSPASTETDPPPPPQEQEYYKTSSSEYKKPTNTHKSKSFTSLTTPSTTHSHTEYPEKHKTTSHSLPTETTHIKTDVTSPTSYTICTTDPENPHGTLCNINDDLTKESEEIENILQDTGKLVAVILVTMIVSIVLTVLAIWAYKRRARRRRGIVGGQRIRGDVEDESRRERKDGFWKRINKGKQRGTSSSDNLGVPVPPEMTQQNPEMSPPQSTHPHSTQTPSTHHNRLSANTLLNRTLSMASSLTVPPYPGSSAGPGTNRSNSTRTANSVASNVTDDTVIRTKREYQSTVNRLAEQNMHSDHAAVADGFHCAPPNPFEEERNGVIGAGGMGGCGVGINGLGAVDGEGNRRPTAHAPPPPPPPIIRIGEDLNPFQDPDMGDALVADGFRNRERGMHHDYGMQHPPARLENPFEDGVGVYEDVDVPMGDGFRGYIPGQMMNASGSNSNPLDRRVSMRGGQAPRRMSADASSISGESLSSNETLRGDLEDWGGFRGSHAGHGQRRL